MSTRTHTHTEQKAIFFAFGDFEWFKWSVGSASIPRTEAVLEMLNEIVDCISVLYTMFTFNVPRSTGTFKEISSNFGISDVKLFNVLDHQFPFSPFRLLCLIAYYLFPFFTPPPLRPEKLPSTFSNEVSTYSIVILLCFMSSHTYNPFIHYSRLPLRLFRSSYCEG